ncbi:MAG: hypothetical protein ABIP29_03820 [Candidatus Eisenbacteria bacterium]
MKTGPATRPRLLTPWTALAALAVLAAFAAATNPGPRWRVAGTQQADGNVLFDGDPIPAGDPEAMNDLLVAGTVIEWRGHGDLELVSPGNAVLALAPGTAATLPAPPPRWFARTSTARLAEGTLRFVAGPRFRGARLVVTTPARTFEATGGAFEIAHDPAIGTRVDTAGATVERFARAGRAILAAGGR